MQQRLGACDGQQEHRAENRVERRPPLGNVDYSAEDHPCSQHGSEITDYELIDEIADIYFEYVQQCRAATGGDRHIHSEAGEPTEDLRQREHHYRPEHPQAESSVLKNRAMVSN